MASIAACVAKSPKPSPVATSIWNSGPYPGRGTGKDTSSDQIPIIDEKAQDEKLENTQTNNTDFTTFDYSREAGIIYRDDGQLVHIPAPTKDPKDPLNLPLWHKLLGLGCLCCFGALAASAELILGSMLPVFAMEYAGIDPKLLEPLTAHGGFPRGSDPLSNLQNLPGAPPIWRTYLLSSLPVLMMGIANLFLIPLAISVGRRPVLMVCGVLAIIGACWAGKSQSLESHLAARCFQALGAGTVESLIPFIIQDMVFFHQRNTAISGVFAAQGSIIIALGIAAPYCIIRLSWRWVYFITAIGAAVFLVGTFFTLPETRYSRTKAELNGVPRPDSETDYSPRTRKYNWALLNGKKEWRKGFEALLDSMRTFFYPHIFFITMLNSAMIATTFAAGFTVSPALLTAPYSWPFLHLGFCLFPIMIAAACVALITGKAADVVANTFAKKRGRRLPENQLINLVLPTISALIGSIIFGLAGQYPKKYPWPVFLLGLGLMSFGFLGANTVGAVYVLECYPQLAGYVIPLLCSRMFANVHRPALVNIASFRCLIAFVLSFKVSSWIVDFGYLRSMAIYTGVIGFFALLLPVVYIWGPAWRKRWPGPDR